jgi:hypothetical protein
MRAFLRVFFGDLLAGLMKYLYLCVVGRKDGFDAPGKEKYFSSAREKSS